ncbi:MAG: hypothetical protein A2W91_17195 [Bacteroidetes bacterium GWF2_38_335]|nr:MAG: hypothetical protein A2W91_17195 [Bacteroidetes bacterium GWF2_38_335]OFY81419.1 MAG: hypothetical protein A2281_08170 [Bacteroidetes bacterium RIFOXYA12_FULL_38_20]HBS85546.1 sulfurtransferase-like selenium metabolism protein YedF [Bacteroidales bacterium]
MKKLNAKGKLCPVPLIMTKKELQTMEENESLLILLDNETSVKNVSRFLQDNGMSVNIIEKSGVWELQVVKKGNKFEQSNPENYCEIDLPKTHSFVICFQNDKMGHGAEELGKILIKGFINTLPDATILPSTMIFLNSGIHLVTKDSPVIASIKKLEEKGVNILTCGTCLDYYKKMQELGAGKVSNMYEIIEKLSSASKVIYP